MTDKLKRLVVFALDEQRYALHLSAVDRVIRVVHLTPLPKAPDIVLGVIDVQGEIVPVLDVRRRFRLPQRPVDLAEHLILARTKRRAVALVVSAVSEIVSDFGSQVAKGETILRGLEYLEGIMQLRGGLILIHDLDKFLSLDEEQTLEGALSQGFGKQEVPS